jgi:rhodanese-related sulfurtransferase
VEHISRDELKAKMDRGEDFVLVDTMPKRYYRHSHLPGAINLPADQVRERAPELLPDRDAEIIVYCIDPP